MLNRGDQHYRPGQCERYSQRNNSLGRVAGILPVLARSVLTKLNPVQLCRQRNYVLLLMVIIALLSSLCTLITFLQRPQVTSVGSLRAINSINFQISFWLWMTLILSALMEAVVAYQGQQAERQLQLTHRQHGYVQRLRRKDSNYNLQRDHDCDSKLQGQQQQQQRAEFGYQPQQFELVAFDQLTSGDYILVHPGTVLPVSGKIMAGSALLDESNLTGETQTVMRGAAQKLTADAAPGTNLDAVSTSELEQVRAGTKIVAGRLLLKVTQPVMTVNSWKASSALSHDYLLEKLLLFCALSVLPVVLTLGVIVYKKPAYNPVHMALATDYVSSLNLLLAFWVCLMPTTVASLLPAVNLVGVWQLLKQRLLLLNSQVLNRIGEIDAVLLDKTGTVTCGYRSAIGFDPIYPTTRVQLAQVITNALAEDSSAEASSLVLLAKHWLAQYNNDRQDNAVSQLGERINVSDVFLDTFHQLTGVMLTVQQLDGTPHRVPLRWGSAKSIQRFCLQGWEAAGEQLQTQLQAIAQVGDGELIIADTERIYGVVQLHDHLKNASINLADSFSQLGLRVQLISCDNILTVERTASDLGITEYSCAASAAVKAQLVQQAQRQGQMVAMIGDGLNDVAALAQADLAIAVNTNSTNHVDNQIKRVADIIALDASSCSKLPLIFQIGQRLLAVRGALVTFSIVSDTAKCLLIVPAMLIGFYPQLARWNWLQLSSPTSAIIAALIFSVLTIIISLPLAFSEVGLSKGCATHGRSPAQPTVRRLKRHLQYFGVLGVVITLVFVKLLDSWV